MKAQRSILKGPRKKKRPVQMTVLKIIRKKAARKKIPIIPGIVKWLEKETWRSFVQQAETVEEDEEWTSF